MMPNLNRFLSDTLTLPAGALIWEQSRRLADLFPGKYILETQDYDFDLEEYAKSGRCSLHVLDELHSQLDAKWYTAEEGAILEVRNAFLEVQWRGRRLHVLAVTYNDGCGNPRNYVIADDMPTAKDFFTAVCQFGSVVEGEILVYANGYWKKDAALLRQIETARLEDLVLPEGMKEALVEGVVGFFASRDVYDSLGVAWKRGVLLLGPPGNGKTHAIKAIVQAMKLPCLYVRSFRASRSTPAQHIERVFKKARATAPCLLILEDLDSLIDRSYLSYFLNEMDGFAANRGVLTIASTNHPQRLDPALLERPSRFDRKITFELPAEPERRRILASLNEKREPGMRMTEAQLDKVARKTDGFSFAYLKELHLSATMEWMKQREPDSIGRITKQLVKPLKAQMRTDPRLAGAGYED